MKFLNRIAYRLRKCPELKKKLKNIYQNIGNLVSDKKTWPTCIEQISSDGEEHLFGYYDKSPWNKDESKIIYLEVNNSSIETAPKSEASIIMKDLASNKEVKIGVTRAWNVQQGCMLQWLGPDYSSKIIYNDFINNELRSVILNLKTNEKKIVDYPIYSVDANGQYALTLDFYRLHRLRPGYGYSNKIDHSKDSKIPEGYCIWSIDLKNNLKKGIITYKQLVEIDHLDSMDGAEHKVNHIMINPDGNRFMFLHRWIKNGVKSTRLLTANMDGTEIYNLSDDDMTSHCIWKDSTTILGWVKKNDIGTGYFLMKDRSKNYKIIAKDQLDVDGHPSYNMEKKYFITDTYPDFKRKQHLYLYDVENKKVIKIADIYSNIKYNNDCRCDLHPRWNFSGTKICFDGAQKEKRQVYVIDIEKQIMECEKNGSNFSNCDDRSTKRRKVY